MATIQNLYNNCFLNVILQLITTTKDIMDSFKKEAYVNFFDLYDKETIISPINFMVYYHSIHKDLVFGRQQDSTEPLTYILDDSDDKTPFKVNIKQKVYNRSIVNDLVTYNISESIASENMLAVPIKDNIQESINSLFDEVPAEKYLVGDEEKFTPKIEYYPDNSPKYLFVSIKRFDQYTGGKDSRPVKINESIVYADCKYKLIAFVVHHGASIAGHYLMYKIKNGKWYIFDDSSKKEIDDITVSKFQNIGYIYLFVKEEFYESVTGKVKREVIDLTLELPIDDDCTKGMTKNFFNLIDEELSKKSAKILFEKYNPKNSLLNFLDESFPANEFNDDEPEYLTLDDQSVPFDNEDETGFLTDNETCDEM